MPSTGRRFPTSHIAGGTWTGPGNIYADDSVYASSAPPKNGNTSLDARTFGFDVLIPVGATITRVVVEYEYRLSTTASIGYITMLYRHGGANLTAAVDTSEPTIDTVRSYDVTAAVPWTRADLLDAVFGTAVLCERGNTNTAYTIYVDCLAVTVDYTEPATVDERSGSVAIVAVPTLPVMGERTSDGFCQASATPQITAQGGRESADAAEIAAASNLVLAIETERPGSLDILAVAEIQVTGELASEETEERQSSVLLVAYPVLEMTVQRESSGTGEVAGSPLIEMETDRQTGTDVDLVAFATIVVVGEAIREASVALLAMVVVDLTGQTERHGVLLVTANPGLELTLEPERIGIAESAVRPDLAVVAMPERPGAVEVGAAPDPMITGETKRLGAMDIPASTLIELLVESILLPTVRQAGPGRVSVIPNSARAAPASTLARIDIHRPITIVLTETGPRRGHHD